MGPNFCFGVKKSCINTENGVNYETMGIFINCFDGCCGSFVRWLQSEPTENSG